MGVTSGQAARLRELVKHSRYDSHAIALSIHIFVTKVTGLPPVGPSVGPSQALGVMSFVCRNIAESRPLALSRA